jgi:type II secretory ATPase GspE/PulE/Tfp pilus assembly ATPase PilB-like protein
MPEMASRAAQLGLASMLKDGLGKVMLGLTTLDEVAAAVHG